VDVLGNAKALFPYSQPALFAMPIAFALAIAFSKLDATQRAAAEKEAFEDQFVRAQTGYGAAAAANH
jgi:cation/acetate symporter